MLTPKAKFWKALKKVKKNWSNELKRATSRYYIYVSCQGERQTRKHGIADLKRIHYATRMTILE